MKRIILTAVLCCITAAAAFAADSLIVHRTVYFDVDKYEINPSAQFQLDSMIKSLRDQGECSVSIYGSTDIDGSAGYNQQLSERRAHAVQAYLTAHDIKAVKCITKGLGRKGDELSKAENRRVDVELRFTYFNSVSDLFQSLSKDADQHFEIDPAVLNEIRCHDKTIISIPAGSLLLPHGEKPDGKVTITVREAISNADILTQDLNSISDDRMLETRGMVYIAASSNGQELTLDPSKPLSVSIPSANATEKDMKLFYGARHSSTQVMNWQLAESRRFLPDVKTVPIDLDRSMLSAMINTNRVKPTIPAASSDIVPIPTAPTKPREPSVMAEPQREDRYHATAMEKTFNKKKIDRKNEQLYQQELHKYQVYLDRKAAYDTKIKTYEQALATYKEQKAAFDQEGLRRLDIARQYFRELYAYSAQGSINSVVKSIENIPITNKTIITAAFSNKLIEHHPIDQHQQLKRILGQTYFHFYQYDDPKTVISDIDNTICAKADRNIPTFRIIGYAGIYDSLMRTSHLTDTLGALQDRILTRCVELGLFDQKNVAGYVASVSQLGWINCDRFNNTPSDQLVRMRIQENDDVKMYMVFTDIKSCLPIGKEGNEYISSMIPGGKNVRIIAVKVVEGKPQLAISPVNTSNSGPLVLQYKTCSLTDIRNSFAAM